MRPQYIFIFCIELVILFKADSCGSNGILELGTDEISNKLVHSSFLPEYDRVITHRIPNLNVSEMSQRPADHETLIKLAHTLDEEFYSLEKIIINSEWTDPLVIDGVTSGLNQTMGEIKNHNQKEGLDYLLRRIIQKLEQSFENIIQTVKPIVQMRQVLQEIPNGLELAHFRNNSLEIYQVWLSSVASDLAYLCNYYAYGDQEKKEEITAYLNRIVGLLERLSTKNEINTLRDEIEGLQITASILLESVHSGALMNEITQMDLNSVSTFTNNDNNTSSGPLEGNDHKVDFLYDMITEMEELQNTPNNRTGFDKHIKRDQILNLVKAIGVENIPEENQRTRLQDIVEQLEENYNNNEYRNRHYALLNDVKDFFEHLKEEEIINDYINLSKRYSLINSVINLLIKLLLEPDIPEEFETELINVLTNLIAIQEHVIRTIKLLPASEKPAYEGLRNERLKDEINKIEKEIGEFSRIVNVNEAPHILRRITDHTLTVLEKLNLIALNYLPGDILGKIYHVNVYLMSLVVSGRAFDKYTREEIDTLKKKMDELESQISQMGEEFRKIQLEFKAGETDVNILRIQVGNIFISISKLRMLDYITDDVLDKLVRLETDVLTFITEETSLKKKEDVSKIEKQELSKSSCRHMMDSQYIENIKNEREDSVVKKINNLETDLKQLKSSLTTEARGNWFFVTSLGYMNEQLIYDLKLLQGTTTTVESKDRISTVVKDAEDFKTELKLTIEELNKTMGNTTKCEYETHSFMHSIQEELQVILSAVREIIGHTREGTLKRMSSIEESLTNILNTHSMFGTRRITYSIKSSDDLAPHVNSPDIVPLNTTELLFGLQGRIERIKEQLLETNHDGSLTSLLGETWNIFELLEIFQGLDALNSSKAKFQLLKEEVKTVTDNIDSQIKQRTEGNKTENQNTEGYDGKYREILAALKKNIRKYEKEYFRIRGSFLKNDSDDQAISEVVNKLKDAYSRVIDLSKIDADNDVRTQVMSLAIIVKTILESEEERKSKRVS